jgi:hypothetical protein
MDVFINPVSASSVGHGGKIRSHSSPPAIECVALAAAFLKKKFFAVINAGTS